MKKRLFSASLILFFTTITQAQVVQNKKTGDENQIFEKVPVEASTNEKAWGDHIKRKTHLPDSTITNIPAGTYKITVHFIIDKHGSIGQIKALNDPGYGLGDRAEKAVLSYTGVWRPAVQCGRQVKAYKKKVIIFVVPNNQPNL